MRMVTVLHPHRVDAYNKLNGRARLEWVWRESDYISVPAIDIMNTYPLLDCMDDRSRVMLAMAYAGAGGNLRKADPRLTELLPAGSYDGRTIRPTRKAAA